MASVYSSEHHSPKTVDQVWKDMVSGRATSTTQQHMTNEDFLTNKTDDDEHHGVGIGVSPPPSSSGTRRGKLKKGMEEPLLDKATLQKQKRMIKNRESAARSRECKQAYTVELESLVIQMEEEEKILLREEDDKNKQRLKEACNISSAPFLVQAAS